MTIEQGKEIYSKSVRILFLKIINNNNFIWQKIDKKFKFDSLGLQAVNASPSYPLLHVQAITTNFCLSITSHIAFFPQGLIVSQAFSHFLLIQASIPGQSESAWHSSCFSLSQNLNGLPTNPGRHRQAESWFLATHLEFWTQLASLQASTHSLSLHFSDDKHSSSAAHSSWSQRFWGFPV